MDHNPTPTAAHWQRVHESTEEPGRSWTETTPATSLARIEAVTNDPGTPIIDVGGGASHLVDELLRRGHTDVTVLDVSEAALDEARLRLGDAPGVHWLVADVTTWWPTRHYGLWHDRAVFHFLVHPTDRAHYVRAATEGIESGGHLVIATFAPDGPTMCSGLPVRRWSATDLAAEFRDGFHAVDTAQVEHVTPKGGVQPFTWVVLQRRSRARP